MARKLGREYFYQTIQEKRENFHNKNTDILTNELINPYSNYKEINIEEYYKIIFGRNEKYLNSKFSNIPLEELELPFEEKIGESQLENKYIYNSIIIDLEKGGNKKTKNWIITKNLNELNHIKEKDFVITAPVTYVGRNRNGNNARYLYAFTIDLDYVGAEEIRDFFHQVQGNLIPNPNLITNSGNGLHITYLLEEPYPLYKRCKEILNIQKELLTWAIWGEFTSRDKNIQIQNVLQGYRVPGTKTKLGTTVTTFLNLNSCYWNIKNLNEFLRKNRGFNYALDLSMEKELINIKNGVIKYTSKLEEAKEKWPEWFQDRIIDKKPRKYMKYSENLYNWWLRICQNQDPDKAKKIKVGHRYFCALTLVAFATKCGIPKEKVRDDLYDLLPGFEKITTDEENHFVKEDIEDALKIYGTDKAYKFKRDYIEKQCSITIPKSKRNGRTREEHIKIVNATRKMKKELGLPDERKRPERKSPSKEKIKDYLQNNSQIKPLKQISEEIGVPFSTLKKYYSKIKSEIESEKIGNSTALILNNIEKVLYNILFENPEMNKTELSKAAGVDYKTTLKYYDKIKHLIECEIKWKERHLPRNK